MIVVEDQNDQYVPPQDEINAEFFGYPDSSDKILYNRNLGWNFLICKPSKATDATDPNNNAKKRLRSSTSTNRHSFKIRISAPMKCAFYPATFVGSFSLVSKDNVQSRTALSYGKMKIGRFINGLNKSEYLVDAEVYFDQLVKGKITYLRFDFAIGFGFTKISRTCFANRMPIYILSHLSNTNFGEALLEVWWSQYALADTNNVPRMNWKQLIILVTHYLQTYNSWTPTTRDKFMTCITREINDYFIEFWQENNEISVTKTGYDAFWKKFITYIPLMEKFSYYWNAGVIVGFLTKESVEKILQQDPVGTFIVRFGSQTDVPVFGIKKKDEIKHLYVPDREMKLLGLHGVISDARFQMLRVKLCDGTIMDRKDIFPKIMPSNLQPGMKDYWLTYDKTTNSNPSPANSDMMEVSKPEKITSMEVVKSEKNYLDVGGNLRGGCTVCGDAECDQYISENGKACDLCGCLPAKHKKIIKK